MDRIIIYTISDCEHCKKAKEFLRQHKIEFTEKDISQDEKAAEEMARKSGQLETPMVVARLSGKDNIASGLDEEKLKELLMI